MTLYSPDDAIIDGNFDALMHNFAAMKSLDLSLNKNAFCQVSWTFLRQECARELRLLRVDVMDLTTPEEVIRSAEELVHECATLRRLLGGEALKLDLSRNDFPRAFALRIIEVSARTPGRELDQVLSLVNPLPLISSLKLPFAIKSPVPLANG